MRARKAARLSCGCVIGDLAAGVRHERCSEARRLEQAAYTNANRAEFAHGPTQREVYAFRYSAARRRLFEHLGKGTKGVSP